MRQCGTQLSEKLGLALKELLDFDDGKELPRFARPSLIETQAVSNEPAEGLTSATGFGGKKALLFGHDAAASLLVENLFLRFRVRLPRGNTGS
jgi:hypothetical protein